MNKAKEIHLLLDNMSKVGIDEPIFDTYYNTLQLIENTGVETIYTTIPHFLSWSYADKLFVHINGVIHELTLGSCEGTDKEIRVAHNLEKMLLAGSFDWFREW